MKYIFFKKGCKIITDMFPIDELEKMGDFVVYNYLVTKLRSPIVWQILNPDGTGELFLLQRNQFLTSKQLNHILSCPDYRYVAI